MSKSEFINRLSGCLSQLTREEADKHTSYCSELIEDMMEDGLSEYDAVSKLGEPEELAQKILQDMSLPHLMKTRIKPKSGWTALNIVLIVLGFPLWFPLLIAGFAVLLSVYAVIWSLVVAIAAVVLSIGVSGIALTIISVVNFAAFPVASILVLGAGIVLVGAGIITCVGAIYVIKGIILITGSFAKWVKSLFIKKEAEA